MKEKDTRGRKKDSCSWCCGKVYHSILVYESSGIPNQVLPPAAVISMERTEKHQW